jgi:hypothetical protein
MLEEAYSDECFGEVCDIYELVVDDSDDSADDADYAEHTDNVSGVKHNLSLKDSQQHGQATAEENGGILKVLSAHW